MMKVLFAASEVFPLVKTGGLGDVIHALPRTLKKKGVDVRLILPAYREVFEKLNNLRIIGWHQVTGSNRQVSVRLIDAGDELLGLPLILVDVIDLFDRAGGGPYQQDDGNDWIDNAERFTVFSRVVADYAAGNIVSDEWVADVVHSHDWQTGLVSAFLSREVVPTKTVFTIHNLAYGGHFSHNDFVMLHLPGEWWADNGVEFYNNLSMLKSGVIYSDKITTVSPTYSKQILKTAFGYGYESLLRLHAKKLTGILNGIDTDIWNPATDPILAQNYEADNNLIDGKLANKKKLLKTFKLKTNNEMLRAPLIGFAGRLVEQKGIDLIIAAIANLLKSTKANFIIIGRGQGKYHQGLTHLHVENSERVGIHIGYSEEKAHLLEAGLDIFLMPSRFEPCGLNQLYSLAYGTPPVVHHTGGLADTVVDVNKATLKNRTATGFVFRNESLPDFVARIHDAISLYQKPKAWQQLIKNGMKQNFSWQHRADDYIKIYDSIK